MSKCGSWTNKSQDATYEELENAEEGLEKYLLSKMYKEFFQPQSSDDELRDQVIDAAMSSV